MNIDKDILDNIKTVMNELEKYKRSERTKIPMQLMKKEGMYTGGKVLYGFRVNQENKLEPYPPEQKIIEIIIENYQNKTSIYSIVKILEKMNLKSRANNYFSKTQIERIIKNYSLTETARTRKPNIDLIKQYIGE